jgi:hypothetical protein
MTFRHPEQYISPKRQDDGEQAGTWMPERAGTGGPKERCCLRSEWVADRATEASPAEFALIVPCARRGFERSRSIDA